MSAQTTSRRRLWSVGVSALSILVGGGVLAPEAMAAPSGPPTITVGCDAALGSGAVGYDVEANSLPVVYETQSFDTGLVQTGSIGYGNSDRGIIFMAYGQDTDPRVAAANRVTFTVKDASGVVLVTKTFNRADCGARPAPQLTSVTPAAPVFNDQGGTYTIPATAGVEYVVNGKTVAPGTYPFAGNVTIVAVAKDGYKVVGTSSWTHTFTNVPPQPTNVTPAAPTSVDKCGTDKDTYTVPSVDGVTYLLNGKAVAPGTYPATGTVTIKAVAKDGYKVVGTSSWTFEYTNVPCVTPTTQVTPQAPVFNDQPGSDKDTVTVPASDCVTYLLNGKAVAPGTYPATGTVTIKAVAKCGECVLEGQTTWTHQFSSEGGTPPVEQPGPQVPVVEKPAPVPPESSPIHNPPAAQPQAGSVPVVGAGLNQGFGAKTGWDEHVTSQRSNVWRVWLGLSLILFGAGVGAFGYRRRTGGAA